jgi:hypothetical protein
MLPKKILHLKMNQNFLRKNFLKIWKDFYYKLEPNLDLKTTPFNQFLKDNKVLDTSYEKIKTIIIFLNLQMKVIQNLFIFLIN